MTKRVLKEVMGDAIESEFTLVEEKLIDKETRRTSREKDLREKRDGLKRKRERLNG